MGTVVALVSIMLALIAAGSIAYIAWELTAEEEPPARSSDDEPPETGSPL